ncbi:hypothetical protein Tco_0453816 [Tanacetum coccineum]
MANLSDDIQCAGFDTRPPMLDRSDFESWQQRIFLYCLGKENGENILQSIDKGPFKMGKFRETLAEGAKGAEGLPKDIYILINRYTDAKDIWDNVKMLLEGSELTKDERELQLYDDFEHFCQNKGETIREYFVRFTKLINDMRNIKMTMPKMQLNSKFVNNMLPNWGRFVAAVKLNRGLKTSNYDKLNQDTVQNDKVVVQNVQGRHNRGQANYARGAVATGKGGVQNIVGNASPDGQDSNFDNDVDAPPVQDLALNVDNIFQADQCDAFDYDVDESPTAQTMFMANLSSADPIYNEVGPSYDSNILSNVQDHDNYIDSVDAYDEPIGDLDMMEDKVDNLSPQSTPQVLPSFEVYTPPETYPDELEEIIGIPIEVEPLDETPLEDLDLNTCNHDITLSSREIISFDETKPQP